MKNLWKGDITFGLISIPVRVYSAYKGTDLQFKILDSRDKSKIRYERVNEHTGEEVPWDKVVKAYQLSKNQYILVKGENLAPKNSTNINVAMFVNANDISPIFFDKPYYLLPDSTNTKPYILLREALRHTHKVGISKVTIRTRDYMASLYPYENILVLQLLRYSKEFLKISELDFPDINISAKQFTAREIELANQLIEHMTHRWQPDTYHDETRERLLALIKEAAKKEKFLELPEKDKEDTKVVQKAEQDIAALLEKSLEHKR